MAALVGGASTGPSFTAAAVGEFLSGELGYSGGDNSHSK